MTTHLQKILAANSHCIGAFARSANLKYKCDF
jgi:hypothetical protein